MKKLVAVVSALAVSAALSYGGSLSAFVSQWNPDAKNHHDDSDAITGGGVKAVLGDTLGVEIRGSYYDSDVLSLVPADLGLAVNLPLGDLPLALLAHAGGTWYFLDSDSGDVDDELGWYVGAGLELSLGENLGIFAEIQFRNMEYTAIDDRADDLEENDVELDALTYGAGLTVKF